MDTTSFLTIKTTHHKEPSNGRSFLARTKATLRSIKTPSLHLRPTASSLVTSWETPHKTCRDLEGDRAIAMGFQQDLFCFLIKSRRLCLPHTFPRKACP